jgi:hypothetical protein
MPGSRGGFPILELKILYLLRLVKRDTIKIYDIQRPESIIDLGLRHAEQISLLEKIQNAVLAEQSGLIDSGGEICPKCGQKLRKNGVQVSDFHAVFSDHTLRLQRHCCSQYFGHFLSERS